MSVDTRGLIKDNFIKLYTEGGPKATTVKNICDAIPISRTTFYAYFSDAYSVMEEIQEKIINDLFELNRNFPDIDLSNCEKDMPVECFDETLKYISENNKYFKALLGRYSDGQFIYKWKKIIKYHFNEKYKKEFLHYAHVDLVLEQIVSSIIGAYTYWIFHEDEISMDEFSRICFPRMCFDFISY